MSLCVPMFIHHCNKPPMTRLSRCFIVLPQEVLELRRACVHIIMMKNLLLCMFLCLQHVSPFSPIGIRSRQSISTTSLSSSSTTDTSSTPLEGVSDFNEWFTSNQGTKINSIKHAIFNWGRGLEFTSRSNSGKTCVLFQEMKCLCYWYSLNLVCLLYVIAFADRMY